MKQRCSLCRQPLRAGITGCLADLRLLPLVERLCPHYPNRGGRPGGPVAALRRKQRRIEEEMKS